MNNKIDEYIISTDLDKNIEHFHKVFNVKTNFDILYRTLYIGGKKTIIYFVDGFAKDDVLERMMEFFMALSEEDIPNNGHDMAKWFIPYGETDLLRDEASIIKNLLSGVSIMMMEGYDVVFGIDCRQYPARSVQEPDKQKSLRGSRDGFVETLVFNTALIRRRIRDASLTMEMVSAGKASKTDIVLCYMQGRVDNKLLNKIKDKINSINVDALTMNQESLAECIYNRKWINPFPKMKFSERPDATAASILEGNLIILVDNSSSAMIIPSSIFDIIEEIDDYYFPPITGTYLRLSRFVINVLALILTPTWMLMMMNNDYLPQWLEFTKIRETVNVPIIMQFLILEFAIDGLKLAALNTPSVLSTPLSVIAAIVIGDSAVSSGWFNSETMLYMAFVALANYAQPSFELGYALKFMRVILLIATALFGIYGYIGGIVFVITAIVCNKTVAGTSYIYPLFPFSFKQLARRMFRISLSNVKNDDK